MGPPICGIRVMLAIRAMLTSLGVMLIIGNAFGRKADVRPEL